MGGSGRGTGSECCRREQGSAEAEEHFVVRRWVALSLPVGAAPGRSLSTFPDPGTLCYVLLHLVQPCHIPRFSKGPSPPGAVMFCGCGRELPVHKYSPYTVKSVQVLI